jgi:hypothetical protein
MDIQQVSLLTALASLEMGDNPITKQPASPPFFGVAMNPCFMIPLPISDLQILSVAFLCVYDAVQP